jgi:RNA polymerase sigma-70 factor (ECF subfamily)
MYGSPAGPKPAAVSSNFFFARCGNKLRVWLVFFSSGLSDTGVGETDADRARRFQHIALPHLNAAHNLARWLTKNDFDAEDIVQEAYLRAFKYFDSFGGNNARAWLLSIVRRTCYDWLRKNRMLVTTSLADDAEPEQTGEAAINFADQQAAANPETALLQRRDVELLNRLIEELPPDYRAVLILREMEDLSYREIAQIVAIPIGTVMSRLARARGLLLKNWKRQQGGGSSDGV